MKLGLSKDKKSTVAKKTTIKKTEERDITKKIAKNPVDNFSKHQLYEKWMETKGLAEKLNNDIIELKKRFEKEIAEKDNKINGIKKGYTILNTNEETIKRILEYRAKNYNIVLIREKLKINWGIEIEIDELQDILNSDLPQEYEDYFIKCKKTYLENISINTDEQKKVMLEELQMLKDSNAVDLISAGNDLEFRLKLRHELRELIKVTDNLTKNIDMTCENIDENEVLINSMDNLDKASEKIIDLTNFNIKELGGKTSEVNK